MANNDDTTITGDNEPLSKGAVKPCLVVLSNPGAGKLFPLDEPEYLVGRDSHCHIVFEDEGVSRQHARLMLRDGEVILTDLNSRNGTFLNGERIRERALHNGDRVRFGNTVIVKFNYSDHLDEQFQRHLFDLATCDGLTGLFNRRFFIEALRKEYTHAIRHARPLSVIFLDIDHFKQLNDTFGHLAADKVLMALAKLLSQHARNEDVVARYGGEEFTLLLRDCGLAGALAAGERIRASVEKMEVQDDEERILKATISVGIATLEGRRFDAPEELLKAADEQLYRAKREGRNRTCA